MGSESALEGWLREFLAAQGGVAGTVHVLRDGVLALRAAVNIPPPVQKITEFIPKGKGMAGLAWERNRPVATCNLRDDASGDVRPGAKAVAAQAAVAIPVRRSPDELRAVVGIAFASEREFSDEELASFESAAESLPDA